MTSEIVRIINISYTAPDLPTPMVSRPHLVKTLVQIFESNTDLVCVEGGTGYGKTTLMREFAETLDFPCFGIFLKSASRLSYDSVLARTDLAAQVHWYLTSKRPDESIEPSDGELRTLWTKCARTLSRKRTPGFIIVDGLHHIPKDDEPIKRAIMALLPFGVKPFKFLFSGDIDHDVLPYSQALRAKSFQISTFGSHETDLYLKDLVNDKDQRAEYHNALGGVPSLLASVRRQLQTAVGSEGALDPNFSHDMNDLFEAEWSLVSPISTETEKALGFILAYGHPVTADALAKKCSTSSTEIEQTLGVLPFMVYSAKAPGWEFSSDLFRTFTAKKLDHSVEAATEEIASDLLQHPDSPEALTRLPLYLEKTGRTESLLEWFSERRLAAILLKTRTVAGVEPTLQKAIKICHETKNDRALTTYSILRSIMKQIVHVTGMDHEVRARGALGDYDGALAVANHVPLLSQRLRLLAVLADSLSNRPGFQIEPLVKEIAELLPQINVSDLPSEEIIDIATDLYPVDAELALGLLKKVIQSDMDDSSFEVAVARIRLAAIQSKSVGKPSNGGESHHLVPKPQLLDQKLRRLLEVSRIFFDAKSASELLAATKVMEDPSDRLYIHRKWISQHPFREDALDVVESAISDAITDSKFAPNASFYREISTPLPYSKDSERRNRLVAVLDGQQPVISRKGPSVDYIRLQLHLAQCNYVDKDFSRAASRLEDTYLEIVEPITELETRITCLAWFASELHKFDSSGILDKHTQIRELVESEREKTLETILAHSADQFVILSSAIEALSLYLPHVAMQMASRLNTIERRNAAFLHVITSTCSAKTITPRAEQLFEILGSIESELTMDTAIRTVTQRFCLDVKENRRKVSDVQDLVNRLDDCASSSVRAECLGEIAVAIVGCSESTELSNVVDQRLCEEFSSIQGPSEKYRVACGLISTLRPTRPEVAKGIFEYLADHDRGILKSENVENGLFYVLDLLVKTTSGLARADLLKHNDLQQVCKLVAQAPDPDMKVCLFSTLGFFLWRNKQTAFFSEVVNHHIWPILSKYDGSDRESTYKAWINAYAVVWLEDRDRARNAVANFPTGVRNDCISTLCFSLLRGQPFGEPFEDEARNKKKMLDYSEIQNLLRLCEETEEDFNIFVVLEWIADEVSARETLVRWTRDQKAEIARRIYDISQTKLPIPERIQHPGFQLLCAAQAVRIFPIQGVTWDDLIGQGKAISNAADRTFVLAFIASYLPNKMNSHRDRLFKFVESRIDELEAMEDKFQRFCTIANLVGARNKGEASRILKKAFEIVTQSNNRRNAIMEHAIVDLAYKVDPDLPMNLAVLCDDDPARDEYKKRAQRQLDAHQLRKDIGDHRSNIDLGSLRNDPALAAAAWRALGTLNAGRMIPTYMPRLRDMLACASNYPLSTSYPMYSWALSNGILQYSSTPEAGNYLRSMFGGVVKGAEFFFTMAESSGRLGFNPTWQDSGSNENQVVILSGERQKAIGFLKNWIKASTEEYVLIVDPYFRASDLELVMHVVEIDPNLKVRVITGKAAQRNGSSSLSDAYSTAWRRLCEHSPPETEVLVVGFIKSGEAPFHDRWILSKSAGLRLGSSFGSLGHRDSEISVLGSDEVKQLHRTVERYQTKHVRELGGERVAYESFELLP